MTYIFDTKKNLFLSISEQSIFNENTIVNTNIIWYNDGAQIIMKKMNIIICYNII